MDEDILSNQFISGDASVSANREYLEWIESVKNSYRQSQIKAHLQVNAAVLEFNWNLGHDISEIMRTRIWGSGVLNQISLDLKAAFPESRGFSKDNLYRMATFYRFYAGQNEIENKNDTFVAQLVPQIRDSLIISEDSATPVPFPYFLGMVPWGHHIEILQSCKDAREAVFYVEKTMIRKRAVIEPMIGHLKSDHQMMRNYLKGTLGDAINTLMAAAAYNMRHWMNKNVLSSFVSWPKALVGRLENVIFGNENKSACLCLALAMVA